MIGNYVEGTALALSAGLNGLALWYYKNYKDMIGANYNLREENQLLMQWLDEKEETLQELRKRLTPWNKGKTYKQKKSRAGAK